MQIRARAPARHREKTSLALGLGKKSNYGVDRMRRLISLFTLCFWASPAFAGGAAGKVVLDQWDAAYLGDGKAGYVHTIAKEIDRDGKKLIHTIVELRLTVKRFNDTIQMSMDTGSTETADGKVVGVFLRQYLGKQQK